VQKVQREYRRYREYRGGEGPFPKPFGGKRK
jgi:hypothetical protein